MCVPCCRQQGEGPPGYSPGVGKFDSQIFQGLDNLYPGGPFDPLGLVRVFDWACWIDSMPAAAGMPATSLLGLCKARSMSGCQACRMAEPVRQLQCAVLACTCSVARSHRRQGWGTACQSCGRCLQQGMPGNMKLGVSLPALQLAP